MSPSLGGLEVVPLSRGDIAQARTPTDHVDDDRGQVGASEIRYAFHLEADAGAGGGGHGARAGRRGAVAHVNGRHFALCLDEDAPHLRHVSCHIFQQLVLRRDWITEVGPAAGTDSGLGHSFISCH